MSRIVRQSHFRNLIVQPYAPQECYQDLSVAQVHSTAGSTIAASVDAVAFVHGRGSEIGVFRLQDTGKNVKVHTLNAHGGSILHLEYSQTQRDLLLSCAEDHELMIWKDTQHETCTRPIASCAHRGRVVFGTWNDVGDGLLASGSLGSVKLWDSNRSKQRLVSVRIDTDTRAGEFLHGASWDRSQGALLGVVSSDKCLRLIDFRSKSVASVAEKAHVGTGRMRVTAGARGSGVFYTTGSSKTRDRELTAWDQRNLRECLFRTRIDNGIGTLIPMFEPDSGLLILAGKGDTNLRVFEATDSSPYVHPIGNFGGTGTPTLSTTLLPTPACDVMGNEVTRVLKLATGFVEATRLEVPRKEKGITFQSDLFGLTHARSSALSAQEWFEQPKQSSHKSDGKHSPPLIGVKLKMVNQVRAELKLLSQVEKEVKQAAERRKKQDLKHIEKQKKERANKEKSEQLKDEKHFAETNARFSSFFGYTAKFKYARGALAKRDDCYYNLWPELPTVDASSLVAASNKFFAIPWKGGGGAVYVSALKDVGKVDHPEKVPLLQGHSGTVYALDFCPVDDNLLASGGEDCVIRTWSIPDNGFRHQSMSSIACEQRAGTLKGHRGSIRKLAFHPLASNVLASSASDGTVKVWDIESPDAKVTFEKQMFEDWVTDLSWSYKGDKLLASSRDGSCHILDPQKQTRVASFKPFEGNGMHRAIFVGESDLIFASGFVKRGTRQLSLWDPRNLTRAMHTLDLDASRAVLVPTFIEENGVVVLSAKGECTIRVVEMEGMGRAYCSKPNSKTSLGKMHLCDDFAFPQIQAPHSFTVLPRKSCRVDNVEWVRMLLLNSDAVLAASLTLPRSKELEPYFADDIYPDTRTPTACCTASEWFSGSVKLLGPNRTSMNDCGIKPLSKRDPDEARKVARRGHVQNNKFLKAKEEEERKEKEREANFARMQALAVQRDQYNPNLSMGGKPGKHAGQKESRIVLGVDDHFQGGGEVDDDEWSD